MAGGAASGVVLEPWWAGPISFTDGIAVGSVTIEDTPLVEDVTAAAAADTSVGSVVPVEGPMPS